VVALIAIVMYFNRRKKKAAKPTQGVAQRDEKPSA
jgi:hypothetical protein